MILYFSGTGNSKDIALRLADKLRDRAYDIVELANEDNYNLTLEDDEKLGFVFPVYFYTVPDILKKFVEKLTISQKESNYGYIVVTCGGGIGESGARLARLLYDRGIKISYIHPILMPDNAMIFYNIPSFDENVKRLDLAYTKLDAIIDSIIRRDRMKITKATVSKAFERMYKLSQSTKKFTADENCIGCGMCEKKCPEGIIKLEEGMPVWVKNRCSKCLRCINSCPKQAIQYGSMTKKRNRYVNPNVKL